MLLLTNDKGQTVTDGQNVLFDTIAYETGRCSVHRRNGGAVTLLEKGAYEVRFKANVSGYDRTVPTLAIMLGDDILQETVMRTSIDTCSDERCVSSFTVVRNSIGCNERISVRNIGQSDIGVSSPCLLVRRI